jgi:hypothetical protein
MIFLVIFFLWLKKLFGSNSSSSVTKCDEIGLNVEKLRNLIFWATLLFFGNLFYFWAFLRVSGDFEDSMQSFRLGGIFYTLLATF